MMWMTTRIDGIRSGLAWIAWGGATALTLLTPACGPTASEGRSGPAVSGPKADVRLTVPSGTLLTVEFTETLSSDASREGQRFQAKVVDPVEIAGRRAIAPGSMVLGRVTEVVPSRKIGGKARLTLDFDRLRLSSGDEVTLDAALDSEAKSQTRKDAATIGGATAGGALLGRIIGHDRGHEADGTVLGAIVGAAIGTGIAAANEGEPATIPAGARVVIRITSPMEVTATG